ncbi:hypothetical protein COZ61_00020, partial [Candidatus Berkelbacteria bacterium CG_4_8_14_3_um_filter_33_6]
MKIEAYNVTTSSWGLVYTIPSNQFAGGPHSLQPTDSVINRTTKKIQLRVVATRMNALDAIKTLDIPITLVSCPTQAGTTIIADDATIRKPGGTTIRWSSINDPDSIVISYLTPQNTFPRGNAKNPSGSQWVEPTSDVTYTNTTKKAYCSDKTASVFIKVLEPCPKVDYFRFKNYASTTKEITPGELVTIEWNITNNPSQIQHTINNGTSWSDVTATGSYSWNAYSGGIVKMRYKRSDCNSGNWQESGLLTLNIVAPPQVPTINGPNDGTEFNAKPANGIFNWSNVSSEGYIIDIYQTSNNSINPIDDRSVSSTSFSWSDTDWGSLSDTAYSWRVRANSSKFTVANDGHWVNLTTNEKMVSYPKAWSTPRNFVKLTSLGSFGITSPASGTVKAMPPEIIWTSSDFATSYTIKFTDTTNSSVVLSQDINSAGFLARRWTIPLGDWKDKFVIDRNYNIQVIAKRNTLTRNNGSGQQTLIKKELLLECKKYIDLPTLLNNEKSGSCETDLSYNHKPLFNWYSQSSPTSILGQMPPEITPIEVKWVKGATTYTHILSSDDIANGKYTPPTDMWRSLEAGLDWTVTMYA